jgi:hypothetical protein
MQRLCGLDRSRKLGDRNAICDRLRHVLKRCVVVARQRGAMIARERDESAIIVRRVRRLIFDPLGEQLVKFSIGQAALFAAIIVAQLALVAELPLTGRVVHHRSETDLAETNQCARLGEDSRHRHLATQMQKMFDAQQVCRARLRDRPGQQIGLSVGLLDTLLPPNPQRIEDRGDAAGGELTVE